jgi:hypothetical protein
MDVDSFLENYGEALEARRATVLVGAGISIGAGYPSWDGLLEPHRAQLGVPDDVVDLPMIAQYVENQEGGRQRLVEAICQAIGSVPPNPSENHRLLAQLPLDEVWTSNYDPLVEMVSTGSVVMELDDQFLHAGAVSRRVYKMHGSIRPGEIAPVGGINNLVISQADFDEYEIKHPRFSRLLQAQILTKSFLFIGFSFSDPNFESALKLVRLATPDRLMNHFAIIRREEDDGAMFDLRATDLERSGVHVIEISQYDELTDLLRKLVARTRPSRLLVSGSQPGVRASGAQSDATSRYPTADSIDPHLMEIALELGKGLAQAGIRVTTASLLGAIVGYKLLEELDDHYDPDRMMLVRRHRGEPVDPPNLRSGTVTFIGEDPSTLRDRVFDQVRAVLVLGGSEGTSEEVTRARERGMGVVPMACSGGTALAIWEEMTVDLGSCEVGGRRIDPAVFARLNSTDTADSVDAAVELAKQAMYLPSGFTPPSQGV